MKRQWALVVLLMIAGSGMLYEFAAERFAPSYRLWPRIQAWLTEPPPHGPPEVGGVGPAKGLSVHDQAPLDRITRQAEPSPTPAPAPVPRPQLPLKPPPSGANPALALLNTWSPEALRGKPGDEAIRKLKPADHSPPVQMAPATELPPLGSGLRQSIRRVRVVPGDQPVALTFDLCEQADDVTGYDRAIVNTLRDQQVHATFFAGGKWLRNHEEKAQQLMADPRFEIGNHGWTHGNLRMLSGQHMREQIVWTQAEYQRIWQRLAERAERQGLGEAMRGVPAQPNTLRFPYGTCSPESLRTVNELGLKAIQWDVVSGDAAKGQAPAVMAQRIIQQVKPGSIVVFHANGRGHGTSAALPSVVKELREKGYRFVTVSELLDQGEPQTSAECYELRPGDNRKYDALFGEGTE